MQAYLLWNPATIHGVGRTKGNPHIFPWTCPANNSCSATRIRRAPVTASSSISSQQNHYSVLGISPNSSAADIKKVYRLLALKYHPDVNKDSAADQNFQNIRLAYDILSDETTRAQYDLALLWQGNILGYDDGQKSYRGADSRPNETYREQHHKKENSSFNFETVEGSDEKTHDKERHPFREVLKSSFLSLFLMYTAGIRLSLTFSSLMALLDQKLDAGYKTGYMLAWVLGGRSGILLTLCLSFSSWLWGKRSSNLVVVVFVAMWVGSSLARYAPLPQGAILALLYMSIKLQVELE
ncbi:unnamed protein product [Cuscuta europaea]|uniref:J domain-containing protein n=1 Tax=Cuscuta europaea TaxID=41803 RepID=A0A9P0YY82_CUSEU|nr:unnamed protein product [Cuscuta europaea]